MPTFHIRDLLATTTIIALTIAISNFAVAYREYKISAIVLATPLPLTALVHRRFKLDWRVATGLHYPLAILWAFGFGVAYSFAWRRLPHNFFERDSLGLADPLSFGLLSMEIMAIAALATTVTYALASSFLSRREERRCPDSAPNQ